MDERLDLGGVSALEGELHIARCEIVGGDCEAEALADEASGVSKADTLDGPFKDQSCHARALRWRIRRLGEFGRG